MSGKFDESNRGAIWKNEKKETDKHPDFTGSINVDGHDYWLNGWRRPPDASAKAPAMKFTVRRKDGKPQQQEQPRTQQQKRAEIDDEIPY